MTRLTKENISNQLNGLEGKLSLEGTNSEYVRNLVNLADTIETYQVLAEFSRGRKSKLDDDFVRRYISLLDRAHALWPPGLRELEIWSAKKAMELMLEFGGPIPELTFPEDNY